MTTELEKQFFDTFGIERKLKCSPMECPQMGLHGRDKCAKKLCRVDEDCWKYKQYTSAFYGYPQITDRILLELMCILTKRFDYGDQNWLTKCNDTKELKVSVLRLLSLFTTSAIEKYKHQVQALFEE